MIDFQKFTLSNGLRVLIHEDDSTPVVAINILYDVGSRDESPHMTGLAHLFEHLMYGGSAHIPDYDTPLQRAGGECNAFTNSDITNFYVTIPRDNLELAFWLESDRMLSLRFTAKSLKTQQKVVVEEFKEVCLNEPYGDVWHHISEMAFTTHPYRWPTIGLTPDHIAAVTLDDVKDFFFHHYRPNNAIMVVAGNVTPETVMPLVEKWFGDIPAGDVRPRRLPEEPPQKAQQRRILRAANVPAEALYMAFHMPARAHRDFYAVDLLSDALANGRSSRLFSRLLKEKQLFAQIDAYVMGNVDPGLFFIEGRPVNGVSLEQAEAAVWEELRQLQEKPVPEQEMQKLKNQMESTLVFSEIGVLNKATNLAFYELIGDAGLINRETELYKAVSADDIQRMASQLFREENSVVLYYLPQRKPEAV